MTILNESQNRKKFVYKFTFKKRLIFSIDLIWLNLNISLLKQDKLLTLFQPPWKFHKSEILVYLCKFLKN